MRRASKAYNLYKERDIENGWESSLTAKAAMALSRFFATCSPRGPSTYRGSTPQNGESNGNWDYIGVYRDYRGFAQIGGGLLENQMEIVVV